MATLLNPNNGIEIQDGKSLYVSGEIISDGALSSASITTEALILSNSAPSIIVNGMIWYE